MRVLFVDLNNSARFPALAIGYLVAVLRRADVSIEVFSPLSEGVPGFSRDLPDRLRDHLGRRLYFSTHPGMISAHDAIRTLYKKAASKPHPKLLAGLEASIARHRPDIILVSAYLDHRPSVEAVGRVALAHRLPLLLGGPVFNHAQIAKAWTGIPGLSAIFGGEADEHLVDVCRALVDGQAPTQAGIYRPDRPLEAPALQNLENLPIPDFTDFPWSLYEARVLTIMTGRGCEWGRCTFCSDVVTANGRGFRSRPVERVLEELEQLSERYGTRNTFFLDIKLNSDLRMWNGIIDNYQRVLPGGKWIGTVHVAARGDNGLSLERLAAAKAAGMTRISFGLESASETLNRKMGKGTSMARNLEFVENARSVGLSVRTSMMLGYPGETAEDVAETAEFLRQHGRLFDRVRISRFKAIPGTRFERLYARFPDRFPGLQAFAWRYGEGRADYVYRPAADRAYRRAKADVLARIYAINRKPLPTDAAVFNGLM
jgi:anaerobic magnesium-protoporphyrin IX monomethyl ester cyclase